MRYLLLCFFLILNTCLNAQNLITDPSFESYSELPYGLSQLDRLIHWTQPNTSGTPDYINALANVTSSSNNCSAPENFWGYQYPRTGNGYIAMHTWVNRFFDDREYAYTQLNEALKPNHEYRFTMYTSLTDGAKCASNGHGFLLDAQLPNYGGKDIIKEPTYFYPNKIENTLVWTKIETTYIPSNDRAKYLIIGNFLDENDPRFDLKIYQNVGSGTTCTYYYDDISLVSTGNFIDIEITQLNDCYPIQVEVKAKNVQQGENWKWILDDKFNQSVLGEQQIFTFDTSGIHTIVLQTEEGGKTYILEDTFDVIGVHVPTAQFEIGEERAINNSTTFTNTSENSLNYFWDFGDGNTSTDHSPNHTYIDANDYVVTLIAENEFGCRDTMLQNVYVKCKDRILANVFTPNNDGHNDVFPFDSLAICGDLVVIRIFDRWGKSIYESNDPFIPWDGGDKPSGTYFYIVKYREGEEGGFITLIRGK